MEEKKEDLVFLQLDFPDPNFLDKLKVLCDDYMKKSTIQPPLTARFGIQTHPDNPKVMGCLAWNRQFSELWEEQKYILRTYFPTFKWNQTFLHFNYATGPHIDAIPPDQEVLIMSFGDYEGGDINIILDDGEEVVVRTKNKISYTLGGRYKHYNFPIIGNKISFCITKSAQCPSFGEYSQFS